MRIGLFLKQLDEEYQITIYKGFREQAFTLGVDVVCIHGENFDSTQDLLEGGFRATEYLPLDGAVILSSIITRNLDKAFAQKIEADFHGLPVVSIGAALKDAPSLKVDAKKAVYQLMEHLVQVHGYRRFLYFGGPTFNEDNVNRKKNLTDFIIEHNIEFPGLLLEVIDGLLFSQSNGLLMIKDYVNAHQKREIDAIVCGSDEVAIGVLGFLAESENEEWANCPVTGFDDIPGASFCEPALTTIKQPLTELGKSALRTITDMIYGRSVQKEQTVEALFVQRNSCGCPGTELASRPDVVDILFLENLMKDTSYFGQAMMSAQGADQIASALQEFLERTHSRFFYLFRFSAEAGANASQAILNYRFDAAGDKKVEAIEIRLSVSDFLVDVMDKNPGMISAFHLAYLRCGIQEQGLVFYSSPDETQAYFSHSFVFLSNTFKSLEVQLQDRAYAKNLEDIVQSKTSALLDEATKRRELEEEVLKIGDMERRRFAMDLHDNVCQRLAGMCMMCDQLSGDSEDVAGLSELLKETLQRTRQYAHESFPVEIEDLQFPDSISGLCATMNNGQLFSCLYEQNNEFPMLSEKQKINIYRIVQEALHNAITHSGGTKAVVCATVTDSELKITIEDDGKGFIFQKEDESLKSGKRRPVGLGIKSMKYRAHQIGAHFVLESRMGCGTCLTVSIPLIEKRP